MSFRHLAKSGSISLFYIPSFCHIQVVDERHFASSSILRFQLAFKNLLTIPQQLWIKLLGLLRKKLVSLSDFRVERSDDGHSTGNRNHWEDI